MKSTKKLLSLLLAGVMAVSMAACSKDKETDSDKNPDSSSEGVVDEDTNYSEPVDNFIDAIETKDPILFMKALHDEELVYEKAKFGYSDEECEAEYVTVVETFYGYLAADIGDITSLSWSENSATRLDQKGLEEYETEVKGIWGKEVDVSAGYEAVILISAQGSEGSQDFTSAITVLKINGEWCMYYVATLSPVEG